MHVLAQSCRAQAAPWGFWRCGPRAFLERLITLRLQRKGWDYFQREHLMNPLLPWEVGVVCVLACSKVDLPMWKMFPMKWNKTNLWLIRLSGTCNSETPGWGRVEGIGMKFQIRLSMWNHMSPLDDKCVSESHVLSWNSVATDFEWHWKLQMEILSLLTIV